MQKIFLFGLIVLMISCGKDKTNTTTTNLTTQQKLQNNWTLQSIKDIQYVGSSTSVIDTIVEYGLPGDYINFNTNNKAYFKIAGYTDSAEYSLINDNSMMFDGDTFTINTLTTTDMVLTYYGREVSPVNNWDNVLTLKR